MTHFKIFTVSAFVLALVPCGQASTVASHTEDGNQTMENQTMENQTMENQTMENQTMENQTNTGGAPSGMYNLDKTHAYLKVSYSHMGFSRPILTWTDWESVLNWNAEEPQKSSVTASISAADIEAGSKVWADKLVGEEWFNAAEFPTITFASNGVTLTSGNTGQVTGDLTILGITKPVTLDVTFNKAGKAFGGVTKIGFSARGELLRSEWGLGKYAPANSDEVGIMIEAEYYQPSE
ncbi:MAG: YceI family protein [Hyphomonadaceae bacterium]|nr:YceI family protein [Hyphomonadaceae bacterium]